MRYEVGKIYNGFKLIEAKKSIKEINSISRLFEHEKN